MGRIRLSVPTQVFLGIFALTLVVWILRGLAIFAFLPGIILWILLLLTIGSGVFTSIQRTR